MASLSNLWGSSSNLELTTAPLPPPRPAASNTNTSSGILLRCYSPRNPLGSSTVHWMTAPLAQRLMPSCPSCFHFPNTGNALPVWTPPYPPSLPPWCEANTQPRKQGRVSGTAVSRHHIGSPCTSGTDRRRQDSGRKWIPFPSQAPPQKQGDYTSQKAVRGGGDGRDAMADSLPLEVRGSGPQAWVGDRPRLRGPELWGRAV